MALLAFWILAAVPGDDVAITHVRAITMAGKELDDVTILIRKGKIEAVGKGVAIPIGTRIIRGKGLVAVPGFINVASKIGLAAPGGSTAPYHRVYESFDPTVEELRRLPSLGFTTLAVGDRAGRGLVIKLGSAEMETMAVPGAGFLHLSFRRGTSGKKQLRSLLEKGKRYVDAEKAHREAKKKFEADKKRREKSKEKTKPKAPSPPGKPDATTRVVARFLKGEIPGHLHVGGAADLLHLWQVLDGFSGVSPKIAYEAAPAVWKAAELIGKRKAWVVLRPGLTFLRYSRDRVNPAAELDRAGAKITLVPAEDSFFGHAAFRYHVALMVKYGLRREAALRSFTLHAAEMLGLEARLGSLERGKDGDVVLLSGDPFAFSTRVVKTLVGGRIVYHEGEEE